MGGSEWGGFGAQGGEGLALKRGMVWWFKAGGLGFEMGMVWGFREHGLRVQKVLVHGCHPQHLRVSPRSPPAHLVEARTGELLLQGL